MSVTENSGENINLNYKIGDILKISSSVSAAMRKVLGDALEAQKNISKAILSQHTGIAKAYHSAILATNKQLNEAVKSALSTSHTTSLSAIGKIAIQVRSEAMQAYIKSIDIKSLVASAIKNDSGDVLESNISIDVQGNLSIDKDVYTKDEISKAIEGLPIAKTIDISYQNETVAPNRRSKLMKFIDVITIFNFIKEYGSLVVLYTILYCFTPEDIESTPALKFIINMTASINKNINISYNYYYEIASPNVVLRESFQINSKIRCILPQGTVIFVLERNKKTKTTKIVFKDELADDYIEGWIQSRFVTRHVKN